MSVLTAPQPVSGGYQSLRRFSVDEYHQMIESGILDDEDKVELLEGYVVLKMPKNPQHDGTIDLTNYTVRRVLPAGWLVRIQQAITLAESEPEPDIAVARGNPRTYVNRHPGPADIGMLVEVADSSLTRDRNEKARIYAHASTPHYWIINLIDRQIEVFTQPSGPSAAPAFAQRQVYGIADSVPFVLDGATLGTIPVQELLP